MKLLIILAVILATLTAFFVWNTEKSISIKNRLIDAPDIGNAIPAGIDVAELTLDQAKKIMPKITDNISAVRSMGLLEEIKSKGEEAAGNLSDKIINLIKEPIENKISETFCPQK